MKFWMVSFFCLSLSASGFASETSTSSVWDTGLEHILASFDDGTDLTGWSILAGGTLATIVSHQFDHQTRDVFRDNQKMSRDFSRFGAAWGSGGPGVIIAASQLALDSRNGLAHTESIVLTSITHISIAAMVRRGRPSDPESWTSFPSGHSASSWATATSLSYAYGLKAAIPAYSAAIITMGARLSDDRHWLSDTVAAATIGLFWGRATHFHEQRPSSISWIPFASHKEIGVGVRHEF